MLSLQRTSCLVSAIHNIDVKSPISGFKSLLGQKHVSSLPQYMIGSEQMKMLANKRLIMKINHTPP